MSLSGNRSDTIKLQGFNNLVKSLTFTTCRIVRVGSEAQINTALKELNSQWGTDRFRTLFDEVCSRLEAKILNISNYDFEPVGSSMNALLADCNHVGTALSFAHLDKSHMAVHTYPEANRENGIVTFRIDFDISTCGLITPLSIVDLLLEEIGFNVITIDYKVRGFTRLESGRTIYNDQKLESITDYIHSDNKRRFQFQEYNYPEIQTWQTRLMRNEIDWSELVECGYNGEQSSLSSSEIIHREMRDIFQQQGPRIQSSTPVSKVVR